jgi:iron complex outermembrane receptor protein
VRTRKAKRRSALALSLSASLSAPVAWAMPAVDNLANMSLEELANIEITSVSKRSERLSGASAAVFVIRANDIRRAGASTLPEALRLAPNLQVAKVDARNYAVTARGFNSPFENKLLVLVDGRTVYSPLFSGVFWDAQDVVLEDILRIEVISGPGATLWGANAVNGVINIITRSAVDTAGAMATAGLGPDSRTGAARYGQVDGDSAWRLYGKYTQIDDAHRANGTPTVTGMQRKQAGFRVDSGTAGNSNTVQGDAYQGSLQQLNTRDITIGGANVLGRVVRAQQDGAELSMQAYVDQTRRDQPGAFVERLNTFDLELQQTFAPLGAHGVVAGGGYRLADDHVVNGAGFSFLPADRKLRFTNLFVQDEVTLGATLRAHLGLRFERNSYTGNEYLPSASLAWQAAPQHFLWAQLARAIRVPARIDSDFFAPSKPTTVVAGKTVYVYGGGPDYVSEVARSLQIGYRGQPLPELSIAATLYGTEFDRLRTLEPTAAPAVAGAIAQFQNKARGSGAGVELSASWDVLPHWRLSGGWTAQRLRITTQSDSHDLAGATGLANNDPSSWGQLRSSFDVSDAIQFDLTMRHMGALPTPPLPGYTALDARLGWMVGRKLELSLLVQNIFAADHTEFGPVNNRSVWPRSVFGRATWRF